MFIYDILCILAGPVKFHWTKKISRSYLNKKVWFAILVHINSIAALAMNNTNYAINICMIFNTHTICYHLILWKLRDNWIFYFVDNSIAGTEEFLRLLFFFLFSLWLYVGAYQIFTNGPGDWGSIPGRVMPMIQKMVLLVLRNLWGFFSFSFSAFDCM